MNSTQLAAILNSGTHPEPVYWAVAARDLYSDTRYLTSSSYAPSSRWMKLIEIDRLRNSKAATALRRRKLPAAIDGVPVVGIARMAALREELRKAGGADGDDVVERRMTAFRSDTAAWVRRLAPQLLVAQYTSALGAFQASPEATKILLYPIAHHDWMAKHLGLEARANPEWAPFLQGADLTIQRRRLLDDEIALASHIVVPSSFARQTFIDSGVAASRLHVLPLGGELDRRHSVNHPLTNQGHNVRPLRVLFAGQVNQRKGLSYLLDAASGLQGQVELSLIGPASEAIRQKLRQDYPNVEVGRSLPRPKLLEAMRAADVLVLPSLAEGFGLVALEAMSVGTPAVVTGRTFGSDIIRSGENGWIAEAASADALRTILKRLAEDRTAIVSVGIAAQHTAEQYSWTNYTASIRQFLAEQLNRDA
jgi:glycosyltransferase involved in cell wall biosynthesis